jgi:predicted transcriptional regulator
MTGSSTNETTMSGQSAGDHDLALPALGSTQSKLVYLALVVHSGATIDELRASLRIPALSLYPSLEQLIERDLVEREGETYLPAGKER